MIEEIKKEDNNNISKQIINITNLLNDLDEYLNEIPNLQSQIDEELSDLYHYIENNELSTKQSLKMIKLIREKRIIRRGLNNDYEMKKTYISNRNKLLVDSQRQFFLTEIHKKNKELSSKYKNRRLTDEEIKNLIK